MVGVGFGHKGESKDESSYPEIIYKQHVGRLGHYGCGAIIAIGVLTEVNFDKGYFLVQPSLVGFGDSVRIQKKRPTIITIVPGNPLSFRPLEDSNLTKIVKECEGIKNKKIIAP